MDTRARGTVVCRFPQRVIGRSLNEILGDLRRYGSHIAKGFRRKDAVSLTVGGGESGHVVETPLVCDVADGQSLGGIGCRQVFVPDTALRCTRVTTDMLSCLVKWQVEAAPGTSVSGAASVSVDDRCQQWGRHVDIRDTWSD